MLLKPTDDWGPTTFRSTSIRKVRHPSAGSISIRQRHLSGASCTESAATQPLKNTRATIEVPPPSYNEVTKDEVTETTPLDDPTDFNSHI